MGLNTAAIILNDGLHSIEADTEVGQKIARGMREIGSRYGEDGVVSAGGSHGVIKVLPPVHADYVQIIAIGGNTIRLLGVSGHYEREDVLRDLAGSMGFTLRRKAKVAA
jgi:hypothetical protein